MLAVEPVRLGDHLLVESAVPGFVSPDQQDGRAGGIKREEGPQRAALVLGSQLLHV